MTQTLKSFFFHNYTVLWELLKSFSHKIWSYMNKFHSYLTESINPWYCCENLIVAGDPNIDT